MRLLPLTETIATGLKENHAGRRPSLYGLSLQISRVRVSAWVGTAYASDLSDGHAGWRVTFEWRVIIPIA